ncbi:3395_t:CDS:2, partial [Diversispora eburnea]
MRDIHRYYHIRDVGIPVQQSNSTIVTKFVETLLIMWNILLLLSTPENNICCEQSLIQGKCQEISVTNPDDRQKEKCQGSEPTNHNIHVTEEPDEIEPTKRQCIVQGLTKQLLSSNPIVPPVSSEIMEHEEILAWYYYSDDFENKVIEICCELGVTDKTARMQLYKEMLKHLPGITSGNLHTKANVSIPSISQPKKALLETQ